MYQFHYIVVGIFGGCIGVPGYFLVRGKNLVVASSAKEGKYFCCGWR